MLWALRYPSANLVKVLCWSWTERTTQRWIRDHFLISAMLSNVISVKMLTESGKRKEQISLATLGLAWHWNKLSKCSLGHHCLDSLSYSPLFVSFPWHKLGPRYVFWIAVSIRHWQCKPAQLSTTLRLCWCQKIAAFSQILQAPAAVYTDLCNSQRSFRPSSLTNSKPATAVCTF